MHLLEMIWNGLSGLGPGTMLLKLSFMLVLMGIFWITCELTKHIITVGSKLATDALRYLTILVRGWPEESDDTRRGSKPTSPSNQSYR